ncbi:MAG: TetR/AcrR family transcriptional regulator [Candidatus Marinimicrobia bacterium]|jgi:AcrR family transcriptional regulator|nr:TetR/AcrR family transcriptional regulator [Candidatus Neomarinimicrobiota bacterium]MCK9559590.1 TetR/AcrR family transcriptional regulator [Candidatus Neomarinimicrobiota bacterium]MDD5231314.1 TetR/AcrR family transcriptional regulator [Candidatus Neomarinimicrobiota bacterium]MDD5540903.1 TetR/AcrR family transcriptional regulator [Candidatus Neomarinimicrobiota bacterium]
MMRDENVTRDKILLTAAKLFADKGFEATSMREIAEACQVTKPALYYYFPDKKALFIEIVKAIGENLFQLLDGIEKTKLNPVEKLTEIIKKQFAGVRQHPEIAKFLINVATRNMPTGINISFFENIKRGEMVLKKIINEGKTREYFRSDIDEQTFLFCFTGAINNHIAYYFSHGIDQLNDNNAKKIIDTLTEGVQKRNS